VQDRRTDGEACIVAASVFVWHSRQPAAGDDAAAGAVACADAPVEVELTIVKARRIAAMLEPIAAAGHGRPW
jgi:hypothetical protein